jgi:hypothetical protein
MRISSVSISRSSSSLLHLSSSPSSNNSILSPLCSSLSSLISSFRNYSDTSQSTDSNLSSPSNVVIELIKSGSLNLEIHLYDQLYSNPSLTSHEFHLIIDAISYSDVGLKVLNDSSILKKIPMITLEKLLNLTILTESWHHAHSISLEILSRNDIHSKPFHFLQYILSMKRSSSYSYISQWVDLPNLHQLFSSFSQSNPPTPAIPNLTIQEGFDYILSSWFAMKDLEMKLQNFSLFLQLIDEYKVYPHPLSSNELMSRVLKILTDHSHMTVTLPRNHSFSHPQAPRPLSSSSSSSSSSSTEEEVGTAIGATGEQPISTAASIAPMVETITIQSLLDHYHKTAFTFLHQNLIQNISNNSLFNLYQKYLTTISFIPNPSPQTLETHQSNDDHPNQSSHLRQLLRVYDHEIQPKRNLLYLRRDLLRLLSSFQPRNSFISPHLPIIFEFSQIFLHDSRYSRSVQDTVDICMKLMELFHGNIPNSMNWIEKRSATAAALFESIEGRDGGNGNGYGGRHGPFEPFQKRKLDMIRNINEVFEECIRCEMNYQKLRSSPVVTTTTSHQKKKKKKLSAEQIAHLPSGRDVNQLRSMYYGHVIRATCSGIEDYQLQWDLLNQILQEISPTLRYSGGQIGGGSKYSYDAIGAMYACQYHLSGSRKYEYTSSLSLFAPLSRVSYSNDISMNHHILDMTQYLHEEYETNAMRKTIQTIHKYLHPPSPSSSSSPSSYHRIDYLEALYTQLLLQIQHQTILNTIKDLQQSGYYHLPIGTELSFQSILDHIFCLSFENVERNELLSHITDDLFQQFLMKKLLFRVNIFLKILKTEEFNLDINNLYDVNKYVEGLNTSLIKQQEKDQKSKATSGGGGTGCGELSSNDRRKRNFSKNSLPYQSSQERCAFQIHKYVLQILTQIGHPVGSKAVTKYLLELANHPNADIPSQIFSKVIKMNTLAKKYGEIHELTKVHSTSYQLP